MVMCNTKVIDLSTSATLHYLGKNQCSVSNVVLCGIMRVTLKRAEMRIQTWRWTQLLQMLDVTTTGSHVGIKRSRDVRILILSDAGGLA